MTLSLVYDPMILLSAGLAVALVCRRLNVSILIGYLLVGTVIGHGVLGWVQDEEHQLAHFAQVGVFLLLFSIGIEFSVDDLRRLGSNFVIGGGTQMLSECSCKRRPLFSNRAGTHSPRALASLVG